MRFPIANLEAVKPHLKSLLIATGKHVAEPTGD